MIIHYETKITYTAKETHPDRKYMTDWTPEKVYTYDDRYNINTDCFCGEDDIMDTIKEDLLLVAGGGYDWKHINVIKIDIKEVNKIAV